MTKDRSTSRRGLLIGAAGLAAVAWSWQRFGVKQINLTFAPISGLPGWEWAQAGGLTTAGGNASDAVFLGIGDKDTELLPIDLLCKTLYSTRSTGTPAAVFTDFFCPNCRVMDAVLSERTDLSVTWHELPLLGPNSEQVARAMIAARVQGHGEEMKNSLLKAPFRPSPRFFEAAATDAGLDSRSFTRSMNSGRVTDALAASRATAATLGVWGTPATAIGKRLVLGRLTNDQIDRLIADTGPAC